MKVTDLNPWSRNRNALATRANQDPFQALQRDMSRLFDDFLIDFDGIPAQRGAALGWPVLELHDQGQELLVSAELPGLEQKDIDVFLDDNVLVIKGEKRQEREESLLSERYYGQFERRIRLPVEVDADRIEAHYYNGVLTVTLPKSADAEKKVKHINLT
jgi:HSP20 family protein